MYPYNYNMRTTNRNMYRMNQNDDRFLAGGFVAPLLLGGVAGYALGNNNNRPNYYYYPQPYYYPNTYNNFYYYPYYY